MSQTSLAHRYRSTSQVAKVLDAGRNEYVLISNSAPSFDARHSVPTPVTAAEVARMLDSLAGLLDRHFARRADPKVALRVPTELVESLRERMDDRPELPRLLARAADDLRKQGRTNGQPAEAMLAAAMVADAEVEAAYRRLAHR